MLVGGRAFMLIVVLSCYVEPICAGVKTDKYEINFVQLQYTQDINQNKTLPPVLIIPIFIGNSSNRSFNLNKNQADFNLTLLVNITLQNKDVEDDDINVGFRQTLNRGMGSKNKLFEDSKANIAVRQAENQFENITIMLTNTTLTNEKADNKTMKQVKNMTSGTFPTKDDSMYPASNKTEEGINSTSVTAAASDLDLPPADDNRWQKFSVSTNLTFQNESTTEQPDSSNKGYPAALYNGMIDEISITTNSYTNEESPLPSKIDRWRTFSSKTSYPANEFKPLAGLYYDGFLHKPLIMLPGFIPRKYYNFY